MKNIRNYYLVQIAFSLLPFIIWIAGSLLLESLATIYFANIIFNLTLVIFFFQIIVLLQYISLNKFLNELMLKKNFLRINGLLAVLSTSVFLIFQVLNLLDYITGDYEISISQGFQPVRSISLLSIFIYLFAAHAVFTLNFTAFSMKSVCKKKSNYENVKLKYKKYVIPAMIQAWLPLLILIIFMFISISNDLRRLP